MSLLSLIILAIGLCMDSFAVSLSSGVLMHPFTWRRIGKFAFIMAIFQGAMPVIGWLLGLGFRNYIESYDHWIALGLLVFLGGRMIYEGLQHKEECCFDPCALRTAMCLALATSIDALAVGISLSFLRVDMVLSAIVIALTTLLFFYRRTFYRSLHRKQITKICRSDRWSHSHSIRHKNLYRTSLFLITRSKGTITCILERITDGKVEAQVFPE